MASGTSTYWANKLLDLVLGATAFSAPATSYLALATTASSASGLGTEATGGSYARASNTNNTTTWPAASGGVKSNNVAFTFTTATATWSSGSNMTSAGIMDALTAGNLLYYGDLTVAKPVMSGDTASFAIAAITITVT